MIKKLLFSLLIVGSMQAQTYAPSTPITQNNNLRIVNPPTAQPANQPFVLLWGQTAPYNVIGKYPIADLITQFGTIPNIQQVINAGSTANFNTNLLLNYKTGTPQAVEFSIGDANLTLGVPNSNNYLYFDDAQAIFIRPLTIPNAVNNNHAVNLGQLNNITGNFIPITGTSVGNPVTGGIEFDVNIERKAIYATSGGQLTGSQVTFGDDGQTYINTNSDNTQSGTGVYISGIYVGGNRITAPYIVPTANGQFAQKKYVDDAIAAIGTSQPTNLSYDAANRQVNNSNGTGFVFPFVTGTVPGLASPAIFNHVLATNNPHNVTASQVGLGNVNNTSDADKPVSTAQQNALNLKFNNPTGATTDYIRGDGSLFNLTSAVVSTPFLTITPINSPITNGMSLLQVVNRLVGMINAMSSTTSKTANYTLTNSDYKVKLTSGTAVFTLPTAVGIAGKEYVLKNSGTGTLTIQTTSGQTIDGMVNYPAINIQYRGVRIQSDGANWDVIGQF